MKVLIDTNILISAALSDKGTPYRAYMKAVSHPYRGVICEQNIDELRRVWNRKFPSKINLLNDFLVVALTALELIGIPDEKYKCEHNLRDIKDRPILRAAARAGVDIILTGDKDFLELEIERPKPMTASEFLNL